MLLASPILRSEMLAVDQQNRHGQVQLLAFAKGKLKVSVRLLAFTSEAVRCLFIC